MAQAARVLETPDEGEPDTIDALAAAHACTWTWTRSEARLSLFGGAALLGLPAHLQVDALDALFAELSASGRRALDEALGRRATGETIAMRLEHADGSASFWRGSWSTDGDRAQGVAFPEAPCATGLGVDGLTGLADRACFLARLGARLAEGRGARVVVADLARFRRLNATLGPDLADLVLAALGGRLAAAFPAETVPARIGEDEFALLLEPSAGPGPGPGPRPGMGPGTGDVSVSLRAALEGPLRISGCDVHPSFAFGAGEAAPGEAVGGSEVLRRAVAEMETARFGAEGVGRFDPNDLSRLTLENDVRGALGRGELEPYYQPIVRLADGRLAGFEALVRWRHPRLGLIPPDDFLPLLSEAKLMAALGRHMTRVCAGRLAAWRAAFPEAGDLFMTVNLTMGELERPTLVEDVAAVIQETGLPPRALKLELTEDEVMRDPDAAIVVLEALRRAGAGLAIDDFGMGFSSLSYLTRLPIDTLKVDRYFVRTMAVSENSSKVMRSIVALGRDLGLQIVGEGVEDEAAVARLRDVGCTFAQGFGYARPLGREAAEDYLRESLLAGGARLAGAAASGVAGRP